MNTFANFHMYKTFAKDLYVKMFVTMKHKTDLKEGHVRFRN